MAESRQFAALRKFAASMTPAPGTAPPKRKSSSKPIRMVRQRANPVPLNCVMCGDLFTPRRADIKTCSADCSAKYRKARVRNREHIRRTSYSDITPEQEDAMRRKARKCPMPGCGVRLSNKPGQPNSKHLDHIIPLNPIAGGTHTHGNVRIICAVCNLKRPKDGSDYSGPVTLWAQGEISVGRPDRRRDRSATWITCRKGLHPWTAGNIAVRPNGQKYCRPCRAAYEKSLRPRTQCRCGAPFAASGRTVLCPACTEATGRKAAELHGAGGLTWNQVAALVGYGSGEGARFAARRTGYVPVPVQAKVKTLPLCSCGQLVPDVRGQRQPTCEDCRDATAQRAAELYRAGARLRDIADRLGYGSITSVSNMIKSAGVTDMRIGRPSKPHASDQVA